MKSSELGNSLKPTPIRINCLAQESDPSDLVLKKFGTMNRRKNMFCNLSKKAGSPIGKEIVVDEKRIQSLARLEAGKTGSGKLTLTKEENKQLTKLRNELLKRIHRKVDKRFDSSKNWSVMISPKHNDIRNEVMQKVKFEQIKKRCLHDFERTTTNSLLKERHDYQEETKKAEDAKKAE